MIKKIGKILAYFTLLLNLLGLNAIASEVSVEVSPESPSVGENFSLKFRIKLTNANEEPNISFDPGAAEVLGKDNVGLSIQTMIVNGKLNTIKEMVVVYEMVANRPGKIRISDIKIDSKNGSSKVQDILINVVEQEKRDKQGDVFVLAIPTKKKVYVGEGFNVDYYLYFKVPAGAKEITEFPKLNNFTKRFQTPADGNERVEYNGESYVRQKVYGARLYSTQEGKQYIDPIKLKVQYSSGSQDNGLNGFGFAFRQYKTSVFASKKIEITVVPIPTVNQPKGFTGLVGKHDIKFALNETKFLVNQPIEYSLEIVGGGMLESFEPPKIFADDTLEGFDTKSDFEEQGSVSARKKFEYTTLPRGPLKVPEHELEISYFLPDENRFETQKIKIPAIVVEGEAVARPTKQDEIVPTESKENERPSNLNIKKNMADIELLPIYLEKENTHLFNLKILQRLLILLNLILILSLIPIRDMFSSSIDPEIKRILESIYKDGLSYQKMFIIVNYLTEKNQISGHKKFELSELIQSFSLSDAATKYFINLFETLEKMSYEGKANNINIVVERKFFKELEKFIKRSCEKTDIK